MTRARDMRSILILNIGYRLPVFVYCAVIFVQSSSSVGPGMDISVPGFDKILHFVGYAVLGVLSFRWLQQERLSFKLFKVAGLAALFCLLYGISDEIHQSFVAQRSCEVLDLLADAAGGAAGAFAYPAVVKAWRKRSKAAGRIQEDTR